MENLFIKETLNSPRIIFDHTKKRYEISGKSFPENVKSFYQPIFDWFTNLSSETDEKIRLSFMFDYISSSSIIIIKQLLAHIKKTCERGAQIDVLWHYDADDSDVKDIGEEYEKLVGIKLQFIVKN